MAAGLVSTGLALAGVFLPVLPTTPFLLLAAACFVRSSPRLHRWLYTNPVFGEHFRRYREGEGLPGRAKVLVLAALWISILVAVLVFIPAPLVWAKLAALTSAVLVTVHIVRV